jgi:hypothetical protein
MMMLMMAQTTLGTTRPRFLQGKGEHAESAVGRPRARGTAAAQTARGTRERTRERSQDDCTTARCIESCKRGEFLLHIRFTVMLSQFSI